MAINEDLLINIEARIKGDKSTKDLAEALKKVADESKKTKKEMADLSESSKKLDASTKKAAASSDELASSILSTVGKYASITGAIAALYKGAESSVRQFATLEKAIVGVGKTTDMAGGELAAFTSDIKLLSTQIPMAADQLADIAQIAGTLGVRGSDNLLNFASTVSKLVSATDLSAEGAAAGLKRILDLTGESVDKIDELGSVVVRMGNNFNTTEGQIVPVATQIAKATTTIGLSSSEVVGLATAMATLGDRAELAGSVVGKSFREIENALRKGGAQLEELVRITGITGEQLRKTFQEDPTKVFTSFISGLERIRKEGGSVSSALEMLNLSGDEINKTIPAMATAIDKVTGAISMANDEFKNATALNTEAARAFDTLSADAIKFTNAVNNMATSIGAALAPALRDILKYLTGAVEGIGNFIDATARLGFKEVISGVSKYEDLTGQITKLIAENEKLFQVMEANKELGPDASVAEKTRKYYEITKSVTDATKLLFMSQNDLEKTFQDNAKEISNLSDEAKKASNTLLNFKDQAKQTKNELDKLGNKKVRPEIKPEIDKDAMKKALEEMSQAQNALNNAKLRGVEITGNEIAIIHERSLAEIEQVKLMEKRVEFSKDLTKAQKAQSKDILEQTKTQILLNAYAESEKVIRELNKETLSDQIELSRRIIDSSGDEMDILKAKLAFEKETMKTREESIHSIIEGLNERIKKEEESNKGQKSYLRLIVEQYKRSLDLLDINKRLHDIVSEEEVFKVRVQLLPDFGKEVAVGSKAFLESVDEAIAKFNKLFDTTVPAMSAKMIKDISLGLGAFMSDFKGMFAVSGKVLGDTIRYLTLDMASDIGSGFSKMFGKSWEDFKNSWAKTMGDAGEAIKRDWEQAGRDFADIGNGINSFVQAVGEYIGILDKPKSPAEIATGPIDKPSWLSSMWDDGVQKLKPAADWIEKKTKKSFEFLGDVFDKAWAAMPSFEQIIKGLDDFLVKFGGMIGSVADGLVTVFSTLFDPDAISGLADSMTRIVDQLPSLLTKAFSSLTQAFIKFADKLPEVVTKLMDAMNVLVQRLMDAAPAMIEGLMKGLNNFLDRLTDIAGRILDSLPDILSSFLKKLPETITKFFAAIGGVLAQIVKAIPGVLVEILEYLPSIVESFIIGLIDSIGMVAEAFLDWFMSGGAEKIVAAIIRAIPRLIVAIVRGFVTGMAKAIGRIFGGFKIPDALGKLPEEFSKGLKNLAKSATNEASQIFKVLDLKAEARGMDAATRIQDATDQAMTRIGEKFKGLLALLKESLAALTALLNDWFTKIGDLGTKIWEGFIAAATAGYDALLKLGAFIWDGFLRPMLEQGASVLMSLGSYIWDGLLRPILEHASDVFLKIGAFIWDGFLRPLMEKGASTFLSLGSYIWEGLLRPILERGRDALFALGVQIWQGLVDSIKGGAAAVFTNLGQLITDGLLKNFKWPSLPEISKSLKNFDWPSVPGLPSSLKGFLWPELPSSLPKALKNFQWPSIPMPDVDAQALRDKFYRLGVDIGNGLISAITSIDWGGIFQIPGGNGGGGGWNPFGSTGGLVTTNGIKYMASGGLARGIDTVPAMLAPGEFVLNRGAVESVGLDNVRKINRGAVSGGNSSMTNNYAINVEISFDGMPDENFVRSKLIPEIKREIKKASLKGELLVSKRGVF